MWKGVNYTDVCKIEKDQLEAKFTEDVRREMLEKIKRRQQAPQTRVGVPAVTATHKGDIQGKKAAAAGMMNNTNADLRVVNGDCASGFYSPSQQQQLNLFNEDDFLDLL